MPSADRLTFKIDGQVHAAVCVEAVFVTLNKRRTTGPLFLPIVEQFFANHGKAITTVQLSDSAKGRKPKRSDFDIIPRWLSEDSSAAVLGVQFHSGSTKMMLAPRLEYLHEERPGETPVGVIRISLPDDGSGAAAAELRNIAQAVNGAGLAWGWVGYSLTWDSSEYEADEVREWIVGKLKRFPALSTGEVVDFLTWSRSGLPHVGWLTLVGAEPVEKLGATESAEARAGAVGLTSSRLGGGGLAFQAGPAPQLGDTNRADTLPLQHAVGKLLEPIRVRDDALQDAAGLIDLEEAGMDEDEGRAWALRFFVS